MPSDCRCSAYSSTVIKMPKKEAQDRIKRLEELLAKLQEENRDLKKVIKDLLNRE